MFCGCWAADWASFGASVPGRVGGPVWVRLGLCVSGDHIVGNHMPLHIDNPILLYTCALENFVVKTTSLSKALLLFFAFFALRAPTCQQDWNTLQIKLCLTVFYP